MAADGGAEHYGRIARLLNQPRRRSLDLLHKFGPLTTEELLDRWSTEHPDDLAGRKELHGRRMVTAALWRLEALGWIQDRDGELTITPDGCAALRADAGEPNAGEPNQ